MRRIEADCKSSILNLSTERSGEASRQSIVGFLARAFLQNQFVCVCKTILSILVEKAI